MENQNDIVTIFKTAQKSKTLSDAAQNACAVIFENNKMIISNIKTTLNVLATSVHPPDQKLYALCQTHIPEGCFENKRSIKIKNVTINPDIEAKVNSILSSPAPAILRKTQESRIGKSSDKPRVSQSVLKGLLAKIIQASTKVTEIENVVST